MSAPPDPEEAYSHAALRAAVVSVFFCGLSFSVIGFAVFSGRTGLGVLLGGALATANLWVFAQVGQAFLVRRGSTAPWGVVAALKLLVLFGGVWLILRNDLVSGISLAAGYAALPCGIILASLFGPRPPEIDPPSTESSRRDRDVIKRRRAGSDGPDQGPPP
jgi:hypothetical protein